jgi:hypothetical protein
MAATKRKRRGDQAGPAKKPKRNEKDAGKTAKSPVVVQEEEEDRDRIPGPVCKVEGATGLYPRRPRAPSLGGCLPDSSPAPCGGAGC